MGVTWSKYNPVGFALSDANLTLSRNADGSWHNTRANSELLSTAAGGKFYWEILINDAGSYSGTNNGTLVGIISNASAINTGLDVAAGYGYWCYDGNKVHDGSWEVYGWFFTDGDVVGVALDLDNGKIWFSKNGDFPGAGDPAAGTGEAYSGISGADFVPALAAYAADQSATLQAAAGDLSYSAPSGFSLLVARDINYETWRRDGKAEHALSLDEKTIWDTSTGNDSTQSLGYKSTGKWYVEIHATSADPNSLVGVSDGNLAVTNYAGESGNSIGFSSGNTTFDGDYTGTVNLGGWSAGDILCFAFDADTGKMWGRINNGAWANSGDPVAGTGQLQTLTGNIYLVASPYTAGSETSNAYTIKSLVDNQTYSAPSGFAAWSAPSLTGALAVFDQIYSLNADHLAVLSQIYNFTDPVIGSLEQPYSLVDFVRRQHVQTYSLLLGAFLRQPYGDIYKLTAKLVQYYGDSTLLRRVLLQLYDDALALRSTLVQPYSYPAYLQAILEQRYSISATELRAVSEQLWSIRNVELARAMLRQPFALLGQKQLLRYDVAVAADGAALRVDHINIEAGRDQYCMSCESHLVSQADYVQCRIMDDLIVTIDSEVFEFFIESRQRNRGHATAEYVISGLSKTALLDAPYADPVTDELSGMASQIVAGLAVGYTVNWQTVDWYIPENVLFVADETPLAVIRKIAAAAGAILQTEPDGTLTVEPAYPVPVNQWATAAVDHTLSDALDFFTTAENFDHRPGYNRFLISDQLTSDESLRLEEEAITGYKKYIRAYQIPWADDFTLSHTGGDWITIEPLGIEERLLEDELVEFVGGEGSTSYPIYELVAVEWLQAGLGTVEFEEDGTLRADVEAESLLKISYRTKCRKYLATDTRVEPVQLVVEAAE